MASSIRPLRNEAYTVAIICALPHETAACKLIFDILHDRPRTQSLRDTNSYQLGICAGHNTVLTWLPLGVYGTNSAAAVVTDLKSSFPSLDFGLFVGIGGGIPSKSRDVRLGDVVVGKPEGTAGGVVQYDLGKVERGGNFKRTGLLNRPPAVLLNAAAGLEAGSQSDISECLDEIYSRHPSSKTHFPYPGAENDNLYKAEYEHQGDGETCEACCRSNLVDRDTRKNSNPVVHYGTIASGNLVVKDAATRDRIGNSMGAICFEMEAAGVVNNLPCLVIRGICDYCDTHKNDRWQPYAALTASAYAKKLLCNIIPTPARGDAYQKLLDRLPRAKGAPFGSYTNKTEPECLPDTRVDLLRGIQEWVENVQSKKILWLRGHAGTGKSTIARTVARNFSHLLGASFFFKRGEPDRGDTEKLCSTLATDLTHHFPLLGGFICNAVENNPNISEKALKRQFESLIIEPLRQVRVTTPRTILFVIDALDECMCDQGHMRLLIHQFSMIEAVEPLYIRIFLTSRPETLVTTSFRRLGDGSFDNLDLRDIDSLAIEHDIYLLFKYEFERIQESHPVQDEDEEYRLPVDWPGDETIHRLVKMTMPWFIAASTICHFVAEPKLDPQIQLDIILNTPNQGLSDLSRIYKQVISQVLIGDESAAQNVPIIFEFKRIIGTIILLEAPLSRRSLARLLMVEKRQISITLRTLGSILSIPAEDFQPIRALHSSLRDFLIDVKEAGGFWVDELETHRNIAKLCIELLSGVLKEDICDLKLPGISIEDIVPGTIETYIPAEVDYACRYWIRHLMLGYGSINDNDIFHEFLKNHLLHWLEASSIINCFPQAVHLIVQLERIPHKGVEASRLLYDVQRFTQRFRSTITSWPLQVYSSCMLFAPGESLVRKLFSDAYPVWIEQISSPEGNWDEVKHHLTGHNDRVTTLAFSQCGRQLASGSEDFTVRLWDTVNGVEIYTLNGHLGGARGVAFLPDEEELATISHDQTVRLWDIATGALTYQSKSETEGSGYYFTTCFSPNGEYLASARYSEGNYRAIALRGVTNEKIEAKRVFDASGDFREQIALSAEPIRLATIVEGKAVKIWDAVTGVHIKTLESEKDNYLDIIALSPGGGQVAAGSNLGLRLWNVSTGSREWRLENIFKARGLGSIAHLAFSAAGRLLIASGTKEDPFRTSEITLIDTAAKTLVGTAHLKFVPTCITISPDGDQLAIGSNRGEVIILDARAILGMRMVRKLDYIEEKLVLSPNGKRLAAKLHSSSHYGLWDASSGELMKILEDRLAIGVPSKKIEFSPNGKNIAIYSPRANEAEVWDTESLVRVRRLEYPDACPASVAFSSDGGMLAIWFQEAETGLCIWDTSTGALLLSQQNLDSSLYHEYNNWLRGFYFMVFSLDGRLVLVSKTIQILDTATGNILHTIQRDGSMDTVRGVALSPDGKLLLCLSHTGETEVLNLDTGNIEQRIPGLAREAVAKGLERWNVTLSNSFMRHVHRHSSNKTLQSTSWHDDACARFHHQLYYFDGEWIQRDGQRILKIPDEYNTRRSYCGENIVAMAFKSRADITVIFRIYFHDPEIDFLRSFSNIRDQIANDSRVYSPVFSTIRQLYARYTQRS